MKKLLLILAVALFSVASLFAQKMSDTEFSSVMKEAISTFNSKLPVVIDSETRADNVMFYEPKTLIYNYTLYNKYKSDINNWETLKNNLYTTLLNKIKTNPDIAFFRDNDVIFNYNYYDKTGIFLFGIKIYPVDYKSYY